MAICPGCGISFAGVDRRGRPIRTCSPSCASRVRQLEKPRADIAERFWSKVDRNGPVPPNQPELGPCWLWVGGRQHGQDHGKFWRDGRDQQAHRVAWELAEGRPFPPDLMACHRCDVKSCVRPDHIYPGTGADNAQDAIERDQWGDHHPPAKSLPPGVLLLADAAVRLGVSGKTVRRWVKAGQISSTLVGRRLVVPEAEVLERLTPV